MDHVLGSDVVAGSSQCNVLSGAVRTEVLSVKAMELRGDDYCFNTQCI